MCNQGWPDFSSSGGGYFDSHFSGGGTAGGISSFLIQNSAIFKGGGPEMSIFA